MIYVVSMNDKAIMLFMYVIHKLYINNVVIMNDEVKINNIFL